MKRKAQKCTVRVWQDNHQRILDKIQNFCLMDDAFMSFVLKNNKKAIECILRIIFQDPGITVDEVIVQDVVPNLHGRAVRLDIHAIDGKGRHFNIEIQRDKYGVSPKRSRHNGAILDMENVPKGGDPQQLPVTYVLFICELDPFGKGLPVYTVKKRIEETGEPYDDGMHYLFFNASYYADDDFGRLSRDLKEKDPQKMYFKPLADAAAQAKNDRKGVSEMCRIMEEFQEECLQEGLEKGREEGREEGQLISRRETVRSLLKFMNVGDIAEKMGYSLDFVKEVAAEP